MPCANTFNTSSSSSSRARGHLNLCCVTQANNSRPQPKPCHQILHSAVVSGHEKKKETLNTASDADTLPLFPFPPHLPIFLSTVPPSISRDINGGGRSKIESVHKLQVKLSRCTSYYIQLKRKESMLQLEGIISHQHIKS